MINMMSLLDYRVNVCEVSSYWQFAEVKSPDKSPDLQMFDLQLNKYEHFSPDWSCGLYLGSETQLQVGENLNMIM